MLNCGCPESLGGLIVINDKIEGPFENEMMQMLCII